jgi:hypothetical protein
MKSFLILAVFIFGATVFAQTKTLETVFAKSDSLYREDQFYFGLTYNRLIKMPVSMSQNGLSTGVNIGFLRDFPVNKSRTFALAIGLGFGYNKYHQNLLVSKTNSGFDYLVLTNTEYDRNKLEQVTIDVPLEIRWRNSTPDRHQFFRIYSGFKLSYVVFNKTKFVGFNTTETAINNPDFNKLQYGPYLAMGYNTWNLQVFYGLNPIFKSAVTNGEKIEMSNINFGLMFYIL